MSSFLISPVDAQTSRTKLPTLELCLSCSKGDKTDQLNALRLQAEGLMANRLLTIQPKLGAGTSKANPAILKDENGKEIARGFISATQNQADDLIKALDTIATKGAQAPAVQGVYVMDTTSAGMREGGYFAKEMARLFGEDSNIGNTTRTIFNFPQGLTETPERRQRVSNIIMSMIGRGDEVMGNRFKNWLVATAGKLTVGGAITGLTAKDLALIENDPNRILFTPRETENTLIGAGSYPFEAPRNIEGTNKVATADKNTKKISITDAPEVPVPVVPNIVQPQQPNQNDTVRNSIPEMPLIPKNPTTQTPQQPLTPQQQLQQLLQGQNPNQNIQALQNELAKQQFQNQLQQLFGQQQRQPQQPLQQGGGNQGGGLGGLPFGGGGGGNGFGQNQFQPTPNPYAYYTPYPYPYVTPTPYVYYPSFTPLPSTSVSPEPTPDWITQEDIDALKLAKEEGEVNEGFLKEFFTDIFTRDSSPIAAIIAHLISIMTTVLKGAQ